MKKKIALTVMGLLICGTLTACGGAETETESAAKTAETEESKEEEETGEETEETPEATEEAAETDEDTSPQKSSGGALEPFDQSGEIEETVLVDENDVKITATGLTYSNYKVDLELLIENNSSQDLSVTSGTLGYACNSVNGLMISDGYLNCEVAAGMKANDTMSFSYNTLMVYGINRIADIEAGFALCDDDYNYTYLAPAQVRTSLADSYDYSAPAYQTAITSDALDYTLSYFAADTLYEQAGVSVVSAALLENSDGRSMLLLETVNDSENMINLSTSRIRMNGLLVYSGDFSSNIVNPGKRRILELDLSKALEPNCWQSYGIGELASVGFSLKQSDAKHNDLTDAEQIDIAISGTVPPIDREGTEVYNANGVRIVSKTVVRADEKYSDYAYVLLLAENSSGRTLTIDDKYKSFSVNGFMSDAGSCNSMEIEDGGCAALVIDMWSSLLEDNGVTDISEITEAGITIEIKDGWDTIDEAKLSMQFYS